jgi:hypothetical protein
MKMHILTNYEIVWGKGCDLQVPLQE